MKKLLDSDWLKAVQFKCNTSAKRVTPGAKSVTPVQITHRTSTSGSCKAMTKILYRNSEKSLLKSKKNCFKKHLPALFPCKFFHVCNINR